MYVQTSGFETITAVDQRLCNGEPHVAIRTNEGCYISFPVAEAEDLVMMLLGAIKESKRVNPPVDAIRGNR